MKLSDYRIYGRHRAVQRGFTMIEIALSLAIIGFALVAIIGVLPAGMSVQRENRQDSIITLDAEYLTDAIRGGSLGPDSLTNYLVSLYTTSVLFDTNGANVASNVLNYIPANLNGAQIIGLLSTPKYIPTNGVNGGLGFYSNVVSAVFRAFNGPAVDMGANQNSKDFAFQYRVNVEVLPSSESGFGAPAGSGGVNVTAPQYVLPWAGGNPADWALARNLQTNLYELRLSFRWPAMPNNQLGTGRRVFRTTVAGQLVNSNPSLPSPYWHFLPDYYVEAVAP